MTNAIGQVRPSHGRSSRRLTLRAMLAWALCMLIATLALPSVAAAETSCSVTWTGPAAGGSWQTAANWSGGAAPSAADSVCVPDGATVDVTSTATAGQLLAPGAKIAVKSASTLELGANVSRVARLDVYGGTLRTAGELATATRLDLDSAVLTGGGALTLEENATGDVRGLTKVDGSTLRNLGALRQVSGTISAGGAAVIDNRGTLTLDLWTCWDCGITYAGAGAPRLVNAGTLVKTATTSTPAIGIAVENQGSVEVAGGSLRLTRGTAPLTTSNGAWRPATGAMVQFESGAFNLADGIAMTGAVEIGSGASVSAGAWQSVPTSLRLNGTLELRGSTPARVATLRAQGGILRTAGELRVATRLEWDGTTLEGGGTLVLEPQATATQTGRPQLNGFALRNEGQFTHSGTVWANADALIDNRGTYTFSTATNCYGCGVDYNGTGTPRFVNQGTVEKTPTGSAVKVGIAVENQGTISTGDGSLYFARGGVAGATSSGAWRTTGTGALLLSTGSFAFSPEATVSGSFEVASGTTLAAAGLQAASATFKLGGTLDLAASTSSRIGTFRASGGVVRTAGEVRVANRFEWDWTNFEGGGVLVIEPQAVATQTSRPQLNGFTLRNEGQFTHSGIVYASGDALIDNRGTYTLSTATNCYGCGVVYNGSGTPRFVNRGSIEKTAVGSSVTMGIALDNQGTVTAAGGALTLDRGTVSATSSTGSLAATGTGRITFSSGSFTLGGDSIARGAVEVGSGAVVSVAGLDASGASLHVRGRLELRSTAKSRAGSLKAEGGTIRGPGQLDVLTGFDWINTTFDGGGTLVVGPQVSGTVQIGRMDNFTLRNEGVLTHGGTWPVWGRNGAVIDNRGTYNLNSEPNYGEAAIRNDGDKTSLFRNRGVLQKTAGTGRSRIEWAFDYGGSVSGSGLGLDGPLTMSEPLAGESYGPGNPAEPNFEKTCAGKPVDCASGNQFEVQTDLTAGGRGLGLNFTRTYNSQAAAGATAPGRLGYGWTASYSDRLTVDRVARLATVSQADGSLVPFLIELDGTFSAPKRVHAKLAENADGTFTYTLPGRTTMTFDANGRLTAQADRNGNRTTLTYDADSRLTTVTDPAGRTLALTYVDGMVDSVTDPSGLKVKYAYTNGELTSVTYEGDETATWRFAYDASHQLTGMTDARGNTTTTAYDSSRRAITQTDALQRTRTWEYLSDGTKITEPNGSITRLWFTKGQPTKIVRALGTTAESTQQMVYDADGNKTEALDANGHKTTFTYDAAGNRLSATDPTGRTFRWTYNADRDVMSASTPSSKTTTIERDTKGNPTAVSRTWSGGTQRVSMAYDARGQLVTLIDPLQNATTFTYDEAGNQRSRTDATGAKTTATFDDNSRVVTVASPRGNADGAAAGSHTTTITRDRFGRATKVRDALGRETETKYDANGNVISVTDAVGRKTEAVYDAENQLVTEILGDGSTRRASYDELGAVIAQINGDGKTTSYVRDKAGRVTDTVDPLNRRTLTRYDAQGNVTNVVDALGRTTTYSYDDADRLTGVSSGTAATTATYSYDTDGRRASMTDRDGTTSYDYDGLGRLTQTGTGAGETVGYAYDAADRRTGITYPNGQSVTTAYDTAGRATSTTDWLGNTTRFDYDPDSNLTKTTFPTTTATADQWAYDAAGQLTSTELGRASGSPASIQYAYNLAGELAKATTAELPDAGVKDFTYDTVGHLTQGGAFNATYDLAENATRLGSSGPLAYDDAGQLTTAGAEGEQTTFGFDAAGQRISTEPPAAPAKTYDYNAAGQLASVSETGQPTVSYSYDGDGLRTERRAGEATTRFVWDKTGDLPMLLAENGTSYIYGPDGLPLEGIDANGTVRFYHHDRLGSTRQVTDDTGAVVAQQSYDAYGTITDTTGTARVPFGFAGEYTETDSELIYLRARFYDPATGQFLTRDPLEAVSGQPYLYAGGDPVNAIDPEGLLSISIPSLRDVSNAAAGFGDTASFGLTSKIRQAIGSDYVDYCSGAYTGGGLAGGAVGAATSVGAGVAALRAVRAGRAATAGAGAARPTFVAGDGTEIVGFTRHGINRAVGDGARRAGTRPEAILDAIKSPAKITEGVDDLGRPFKVYKGGDARVVINPDTGRIVSVNPRSGAGANR